MGYQRVKTENIDGQVYKTMVLAATGSALTAVQVPFIVPAGHSSINPSMSQHVFLTSDDGNIIYKFGADSTTAASATVTNSLLPDGNLIVLEGATLATDLNATTQSWVSVISSDGTTGTAYVMLINNNV